MRTRDLIEDYTAFRMAIKYTDLTNAFFPNDLSAYADIFVTSTTNYEWTIEERRRFFHRSFIHYKVGRISKLEELRPVYEKFRDQLIRRRHRPVLGHEKFGRFCLGYVVAIGFAIYLLVLKFMKL